MSKASSSTQGRRPPPNNLEQMALDGDPIAKALALCRSGRLLYVNSTTFGIAIPFSGGAEGSPAETKNIDLRTHYLPSSRLLPQCTLADDHHLTIATVLAVDSQLMMSKNPKNVHKVVVNTVAILAKLWEWGRLRSLYKPRDWSEAHFSELQKDLKRGGFCAGLDIFNRGIKLINDRVSPKKIAGYEAGTYSYLRVGLKAELHTNLSIQELMPVRPLLLEYCNKGKVQVANTELNWKRLTQSTIRQTLDAINEVSRIHPNYRFARQPFLNALAIARKISKPNKKTRTISVTQAISLFVNSYTWVHERTEVVVSLIQEVTRIALTVQHEKNRHAHLNKMWAQSRVRAEAEEILGVPLRCSRNSASMSGEVSVQEVAHMLMTSCFILIAGMNARRNDEVSHRFIGLKRGSIVPVREDLGIFCGSFYIEKTLQDYAPFYVNKLTYDAYTALCRLDDANRELVKVWEPNAAHLTNNSSLFWLRSYSVGKSRLGALTWYKFHINPHHGRQFWSRQALGFAKDLQGTAPHMFRRFFAIIYIYRFDHGDMIHLRDQLGHFNLESTVEYVTDTLLAMRDARIPVQIQRRPEAMREAFELEKVELLQVVGEVADEKLKAGITALLAGTGAGGGFPRLVMRLHRILSLEVDYSALDTAQQASRVYGMLKQRGHSIRPLSHADCIAGKSQSTTAACSEAGAAPAPENSRPEKCSRCSRGWVGRGHLEGMKADLKELELQLTAESHDTQMRRRKLSDRQELILAIQRTEQRLNG